MARLGGVRAGMGDLRQPNRHAVPVSPAEMMRLAISRFYRSGEWVRLFNRDEQRDNPRKARPGVDLFTVGELLREGPAAVADGLHADCMSRNPFTGERFGDSYTVQQCVSEFRFALVEFDAMPIEVQCAFWLGYMSDERRRAGVAAITYSGNKSLHALLCCPRGSDPDKWAEGLKWKLCCDDTDAFSCKDEDGRMKPYYPWRADVCGFSANGNMRLPGARRGDNGRIQELLYFNPAAIPDLSQQGDTVTYAETLAERREAARRRMAKFVSDNAPSKPHCAPSGRAVPLAVEHTPKAAERVLWPSVRVPRDCSQLPPSWPRGDEPWDEFLAAVETCESFA